jgi:hypothetical protein
MNMVATNLLGRWVKGRWIYINPDYVSPDGDFFHHSKKQRRELTEHQMSLYTHQDLEGKVVAVTSTDDELVFWILRDGKAVALQSSTIMPENWAPEIPR